MALSVRSGSLTWAAAWPSQGITYGGTNFTFHDTQIVNVENNFGGENPFAASHRYLTGSRGVRITPDIPPGQKGFIEPWGPSSFESYSYGYAVESIPSAASIISRTNPSRSVVDVPVFLYELKDIPEMIRFWGRVLLNPRKWAPTDPAKAHLALQFGWKPLITDLVKIGTMMFGIEKRRKEINALYSKGGSRRYVGLGAGQEPPITKSAFANFGTYRNFVVTVTEIRSWKAWAVVHWAPTQPSVLPPSDLQIAAYLTGLHPTQILSDVWEALPWSWLADWFTNIGDVVKDRNHYLAHPTRASVMVQYSTQVTHPGVGAGIDVLTAGCLSGIKRQRTPIVGANIEATLPILSGQQLSILGSLAVTRFLKPKFV